ncbi:MAG: HDOD domain protein [Candidatus Accumulibacter sp. BA-94]|jgi:HD-like signal output (HDOD) protein|uniref:HDOD domain-containing protein n=1 Tax=Accumulibacter sp. TaxID=2053492 RepID=UPI00044A4BD4|nr:HDOD domain-containing protein [Accumulibacter sp.]EXI85031.1 MAG: HDOD domain protein [Candidatus Accumulibacter sp. BA-94]MBL8392253.1 HDOD domain-containing protein [Accumulibacter sp.]HRD87010.1 HDOD domain-containing protein [Accumulibacter sp.]
MAQEMAPELIEKTLKGISIPARPQVLVRLDSELAKDDPEPVVIVRLISSDVVLSAAMLKTVNSPFFGLSRRISSVGQAVNMLGLKMTARIVTGLVLRMTMGGKQASLERFWDTAEKVACISSYIASTLPRGPRDEAYCFGLFRDIGIPMLLQKFPDYRQTLALADNSVDRPMTVLEEERHATDHATLGYLVARSWFLPEAICEGIRYHHDPSVFDSRDLLNPTALALIAINALAEHLHDEYFRMRANAAWQQMADRVLACLGLSEDEYCDLREEVTTLVL